MIIFIFHSSNTDLSLSSWGLVTCIFSCLRVHASERAATPGSTLPSSSSRLAPPPVLTWLTFSSVPYLAQQVAVSPPPMMVTPPRTGQAHHAVHQRPGALSEVLELKHAGRAIPHNHLGPSDDLGKGLSGLWTTVQPHPSVRNTLLHCGGPDCSVLSELVSCHKVNREVKLDILGFGFLHELGDNLGTLLIIE